MSDKVDLRVDWCSYKAAKYAVEHWHYSGTIPANKSNYIGVWENGKYIGAVIFGMGASPSLGKPYGLRNFQFLELTRVALNTHESPVSKIVSLAIKMIRAKNPGIRLLISFADPFHGHNGSIYQAMNWIFTGTSDSAQIYKLTDGTLVDPRRYNGHGHNKPCPVPAGAKLIKTPGKYRYLMPLDEAMRKQIEPLRKPYPKREPRGAGETDNALGTNPETGGASPTAPLSDPVIQDGTG